MPIIDFILHIDQHLENFIQLYGIWVYGLLFMIVFVETGVVFMPFLPGDNLLFAAGALAAIGQLDPVLVAVILGLAAVLGDSCNYWIGRTYGTRLFTPERRFPSLNYLHQAEAFFAKHGGKSVFIGRFFPFIRTFTPFVAGMSHMTYARFLMYSISGTVVWVSTLVTAGYYLGQLAFVKEHLTVIVLGVILVSLLPVFMQGYQQIKAKKYPK